MMQDRPDIPMQHQCEKCKDEAATVVLYMYHLPTKAAKYRYLCPACAHIALSIGFTHEPVVMEAPQ